MEEAVVQACAAGLAPTSLTPAAALLQCPQLLAAALEGLLLGAALCRACHVLGLQKHPVPHELGPVSSCEERCSAAAGLGLHGMLLARVRLTASVLCSAWVVGGSLGYKHMMSMNTLIEVCTG